jgi:hypothetical protein
MSETKKRILQIGVDGIGLADLKSYHLKNFQSALYNGASGKISSPSSLPAAAAWARLV